MNCNNCGHVIDENTEFCPNCGTKNEKKSNQVNFNNNTQSFAYGDQNEQNNIQMNHMNNNMNNSMNDNINHNMNNNMSNSINNHMNNNVNGEINSNINSSNNQFYNTANNITNNKYNKNAIYSIIFSSVSIIIFWWLSLAGISLGFVALKHIKQSGEKGKILAYLGIVIGFIALFLFAITWV